MIVWKKFDFDESECAKSSLCDFVNENNVKVVTIVPDRYMEDFYLFYEVL